jgi:hypothetical protein
MSPRLDLAATSNRSDEHLSHERLVAVLHLKLLPYAHANLMQLWNTPEHSLSAEEPPLTVNTSTPPVSECFPLKLPSPRHLVPILV